MNNAESQIRDLYSKGILTKEEMEAELKKLPISKPAIHNRIWLWVCVAIALIALIFIVITMSKRSADANNSTTSDDNQNVEIKSTTTSATGERQQWEVTEINGAPAIQTKLANSDYGILQMTYSPTVGFSFAFFDNNMNPQNIDDKIVGYIEKGEEFPMMIAMPRREGNKFYYEPQLVEKFNSGAIEYITIERIGEDGSLDEGFSHRWHINWDLDEFSNMIQNL